jgi:hypothetical protein
MYSHGFDLFKFSFASNLTITAGSYIDEFNQFEDSLTEYCQHLEINPNTSANYPSQQVLVNVRKDSTSQWKRAQLCAINE